MFDAVENRQVNLGIREVEVALPGGTMRIGWRDDGGPITMEGPTAFVFEGELAHMDQRS